MTNVTLDHLSYSTVNDYGQCSEKVRLRKIERVPRVPSWAGIGGSAVHQVTAHEDLFDFGIDDGEPATFSDALDRLIAEAEESSGIPRSDWSVSGRASKANPNKEDEKWWRENGPTFVFNWRRMLSTAPYHVWIDPEGNPAVELELEWEIGGVLNKGYVDRVLQHTGNPDWLLVVDLKSGSREPMTKTQLGVYGDGVKARHGILPPWGAFFMCRTGVLTTPISLDKYQDGSLAHDWRTTKRAIDAGIFIPAVSNLCPSCDVRHYCRAFGGEHAADVSPFGVSV